MESQVLAAHRFFEMGFRFCHVVRVSKQQSRKLPSRARLCKRQQCIRRLRDTLQALDGCSDGPFALKLASQQEQRVSNRLRGH